VAPQREDDGQYPADGSHLGCGGDGPGDVVQHPVGDLAAAAQGRVEQGGGQLVHVASGGGDPIRQHCGRCLIERPAVAAALDEGRQAVVVGAYAPLLVEDRVDAGGGAGVPGEAGDPQDSQPVQDPAAIQVGRVGQRQAYVPGPVEPVPLQIGLGVVYQRRKWGRRMQPADAVAAEGGDHLDYRGMGARAQGAPGRPGQGHVERLVDQCGGQSVEDIDPGEVPVAAYPGKPFRRDSRRDQVRRRHRLPPFPQPPDHRGHQLVRGGLGPGVPEPLVVVRRRHPGLVAVEGVEPTERVRHQVAAAGRCGRESRSLRPGEADRGGGAVGGGAELDKCRPVKPAGDDHDRPVPGVGDGRPHPLGHVGLPLGVLRTDRRLAADQVEVDGEPFGEAVGRGDLEQVVPQRVDVVGRERAAQRLHHVDVPLLSVRVAVAPSGERGMPGGQVDEAQLGTHLAARGQRDPLRGVRAERRPGGMLPFRVAIACEDRDGQLVVE